MKDFPFQSNRMSPNALTCAMFGRMVAFVVLLQLLSGCSVMTGLLHYFQSIEHFAVLQSEKRVRFEKGAEDFALKVAAVIPDAVQAVEQAQFGTFQEPVRVNVCKTPESFNKLTGRKVKGLMYRGMVFLSSRLMERPEEIREYVTHELSHLLLLQYIGLYRYLVLPPWFLEGLAVSVSGGGGAGTVSEKEAVEFILSGKAFEPNTAGGLLDILFPKYGNHWGLKPHMFYRQSSVFVNYLKEKDEKAFRTLLVSLQEGVAFSKAFDQAYETTVREEWRSFVGRLKDDLQFRRGEEE